MKTSYVLTVVLLALAILNQGCSSLGELPSGMTWYKPGISADQTKVDWMICQYAASQGCSPQQASDRLRVIPSRPYNSSGTIQPNAYGLGVNSDQYGRPTTYQLQNGKQLDPIFNAGVKQNVYGPGIGQDQFGRPVYNSSGGAGSTSRHYSGGQSSGVGAEIALNALKVMNENSAAKNLMTANGYRLVSTNSPALKDRPEHFTEADFK